MLWKENASFSSGYVPEGAISESSFSKKKGKGKKCKIMESITAINAERCIFFPQHGMIKYKAGYIILYHKTLRILRKARITQSSKKCLLFCVLTISL